MGWATATGTCCCCMYCCWGGCCMYCCWGGCCMYCGGPWAAAPNRLATRASHDGTLYCWRKNAHHKQQYTENITHIDKHAHTDIRSPFTALSPHTYALVESSGSRAAISVRLRRELRYDSQSQQYNKYKQDCMALSLTLTIQSKETIKRSKRAAKIYSRHTYPYAQSAQSHQCTGSSHSPCSNQPQTKQTGEEKNNTTTPSDA